MGCLKIKANECSYREKYKILQERLINGINGDDMMTEIINKLTMSKNTNEITIEQVLS